MTCKQVQEGLVECWGRTEELTSDALTHLETCEQCRHEALLLRETHAMVQSLTTQRAPQGFTEQVLAGVEREERRPGWRERLTQWVLPTRQPSWMRAAAVGALLAVAVAGGAIWYDQGARSEQSPDHARIAASQHTPSTVEFVEAGATDAELDELMLKHQSLELTQPLADDAGVSLVMYTSQ